MRLWSISPVYIDRQGLLACWREGLLAQQVLFGLTKGYKNHPQLDRFKKKTINETMASIGQYLYYIWEEANNRGYNFDIEKIELFDSNLKMTVTKGQLEYEFLHLQTKLMERSPSKYLENAEKQLEKIVPIEPNPLFKVIDGYIESWEKIKWINNL